MQQSTKTVVDIRYNRLFPNALTHNKNAQVPAKLIPLRIDAAKVASNGTPYALITWIMYGDQAAAPPVAIKKPNRFIRKKGFRTRFRFNSLTLSQNEAVFMCSHCVDCSVHKLHAFDSALWFLRFENSARTASKGTHPRSHFREFNASVGRFFDISQLGVSGI